MHFVFVSTMAGALWGGSEELWSQAALRLREQGHEVSASVVWWRRPSQKTLALAEHGVKLYSRKLQQHRPIPIRVWDQLRSRFHVDDERKKWLSTRSPDLIVVSQGGNSDGVEWMKFCQEASLPFVSIVQCNWEAWWPPDAIGRELASAYHAAKNVFCVSRRNLELLEYQIGASLPNATVVCNPFNVPTDQPPVWPLDNGTWKLACVARLEPAAKGQDLLFQVLSGLPWKDRVLELNLYGSGPCEDNLRRLTTRLNLNNVRFHGHVNDVRAIWEQNHLLVLPSRYEGMPLALVEAMWCARPALVTDIGGNAELCVDEETSFVAAAPTVNLVGEALERAWNRRDDLENMGSLARSRVEKLISKDPVADFCTRLVTLAGIGK